jgi:hypothetical protein
MGTQTITPAPNHGTFATASNLAFRDLEFKLILVRTLFRLPSVEPGAALGRSLVRLVLSCFVLWHKPRRRRE